MSQTATLADWNLDLLSMELLGLEDTGLDLNLLGFSAAHTARRRRAACAFAGGVPAHAANLSVFAPYTVDVSRAAGGSAPRRGWGWAKREAARGGDAAR